LPCSLASCSAGINIAINNAIMAITTNNSINVNPLDLFIKPPSVSIDILYIDLMRKMNILFPEFRIFRISQGCFAKVLYIKSAFPAIKNRKKIIPASAFRRYSSAAEMKNMAEKRLFGIESFVS